MHEIKADTKLHLFIFNKVSHKNLLSVVSSKQIPFGCHNNSHHLELTCLRNLTILHNIYKCQRSVLKSEINSSYWILGK